MKTMGSACEPACYQSPVPFTADRIAAAAMYCSDGRYGDQIDDLLHKALGLPRYDRLAVPGGAAWLVDHFGAFFERRGIVKQLEFLIEVHGLARVVLIAHQDCAYYLQQFRIKPADLRCRQEEDLRRAAQVVRSLGPSLVIQAFYAGQYGERIGFEPIEV